MSILTIIAFVAGLILLTLGAEWLVRGASRLATAWGISSLVIGLTVVSFGTSAPELAVSLKAALGGQPALALGNVVGSNIFNVLFILGISAIIVPLSVHMQLLRIDVPVLIGVSALVWAMASGGRLETWHGMVLFGLLFVYLGLLYWMSKKDKVLLPGLEMSEETKPQSGVWWKNVLLVLAGLALLVVGSDLLVRGAIEFARWLGLSELVIGLTIIAAGTSLPEVAASIMAACKGERDIAVGNVVGSNLFNLLCILGLTAWIAPGGIPVPPEAVAFDLPIMTLVAVVCLPVFFTGREIARWEGAIFIGYYVAYTTLLIMKSSGNGSGGIFEQAMLWFVVPLTLITLLASLGLSFHRSGKAG